jgi:hypothetical protein
MGVSTGEKKVNYGARQLRTSFRMLREFFAILNRLN